MSVVKKVKEDYSNLDAVLLSYDTKLKGYKEDLKIDGQTYMQANVQQSAFISYYDQICQELDVLLDDMNMRVKVAKANAIKKIQAHSNREYSERIMNSLVEGDPGVNKAIKAMLEVKERYLKARSIVDAFQQRGYSLNNITKIRIAEFHNETIYIDE